jgi:hypothetical protein
VRGAWTLAAGLAAATVALDVAFRHAAHAVYAWHALPGFDLAYGFLGCALIVVASKALGRAGVQKPESYYEPEE